MHEGRILYLPNVCIQRLPKTVRCNAGLGDRAVSATNDAGTGRVDLLALALRHGSGPSADVVALAAASAAAPAHWPTNDCSSKLSR